MAAMFVRPCRSAAIRTRLDLETVRERLARIARGMASPDTPVARGHVLGGTVGPDGFHLDFRFQGDNPQNYSVHGRIQDAKDWRILRLKLTARDPWLGPVELAVLAGFIALNVWAEELPARAAIAVIGVLMALYALVNLWYAPGLVTRRVSATLAAELDGSVQRGSQWMVP
jgi:hypothetical protein